MAPTLWGVSSYSIFIGLAMVAGVSATLIAGRRLALSWPRLVAAQVLMAFAAILGAELFSSVESGARWAFNIDSSALKLRYPGGVLAVLIALPIITRGLRMSLATLGDVAAVGTCAAMVVIRIGCLLAGCCYGTPSDLPWAIKFSRQSPAWSLHAARGLVPASSQESLAVHPLQVYFGLWSAGVLYILFYLLRRRSQPGLVLLVFLALHESGKALLESLRDPYHPALRYSSGAVALFAFAALALFYARQPLAYGNLDVS